MKLKNKLFFIGALIIFGVMALVIFGRHNIALSPQSVIKKIDLLYAANFADDKILVGASHDVFVGKVISQSGTKQRGVGPETQFSVQVISDIKGTLSGTVIVDQQGGYENGVLYVLGDDDIPGISSQDGPNYLLQPGATYLLATRYNPTENWYTLNSFPTASKLLSSNSSLSTADLQAIAARDPRVAQLQAAYSHEILLAADVAHWNTLNSYVSTHPVQPATLSNSSSTVAASTTTISASSLVEHSTITSTVSSSRN